jgi:DNA-binding beta-propeller fold protein YncE
VGLSAVRGICFGPDGYLYVADRDGSRVSSYDRKTGERVKIVVSEANGLKKPIQVTFTEDGKSLFVGDDETEQVLRLDMDSGLCSVFIPRGTAGLKAPSALVVSAKWLYVGSRLTKEILRFEIATGKPDSKPYVTLPDHPEFLLHVIPPVEPDKK